jgi:hypothetical protein
VDKSIVAVWRALPRPPSVGTVHRRIRAKYNDRSWTMKTRCSSLQVSKAGHPRDSREDSDSFAV